MDTHTIIRNDTTGSVYDLGYTDDQIRAEYISWGYNLEEDQKIVRYGKRPWNWDGSAPTMNRNYTLFHRHHWYNDADGLNYINNNTNEHNRLSYRIPIHLTRQANQGLRPQPQHPEPGQTKVLTHARLGDRIVIYIHAVTTGTLRTAQRRATGTLEYSIYS